MLAPAVPDNEEQRLAELRSLHILDTPAEERFDRITRIAKELFQVPIAVISLVDTNRQWFKSCIGLPVNETERDVSCCGHAILQDDVFVIEDASADERFFDNPLVLGPPNIRFYAGAQLTMSSGNTIGTLCLIDSQPRSFSKHQQLLLKDLAKIVIQELSSHRAAILDDLTQVLNRRGFELMADKALANSRRYQWPCSLLYMDLNNFKAINDNHGHRAGDEALKRFSKIASTLTRETDILARIGGDEFVVMMMNADEHQAEKKVLKIEHAVSELNASHALPCELSVAYGIVAYNQGEHNTLSEFMHSGDQQMYQHKQAIRGLDA